MDQPNINPSEQNIDKENITSPNSPNLSNLSNNFNPLLKIILFLFLGAVAIETVIFLSKPYFPPKTPPQQVTSVPTLSPTSEPGRISITSTERWKTVKNNGVSFKIPPWARCGFSGKDDNDCKEIYFSEANIVYPQKVTVTEHNGGSLKEQFQNEVGSYEDCYPIYKEEKFGTVNALQIAIDWSLCNAGGGAITTVVGNKFVVFIDLTYNPQTKIISRDSIRDTIVSTLKE